MLNIFDQPWTLAVIGVWLELAVLIGARFWPLRFSRKHLLIAPAMIGLAFAVDYLVVTDREKVETVMATVVKASQQEQAEDIIKCISPDYRDRLHSSREAFSWFCRQIFSQPQIEKNWVRNQQLELQKFRATVRITVYTWMDERSPWYQGMPVAKTVWRLELSKQPDKSWLISNIELIELNDEPTDWTVSKEDF